MNYSPLHLRSYFSLLRGCLSPEDLCLWASRRSYSSAGIVDVNNLYGMVRFLKAAERTGIRPVVGCELVRDRAPRFTAYVLSRQGLARLNGILSSHLADRRRWHHTPPQRSADAAYDPASDLLERGWRGLAIVSDEPSLLKRLRERTSEGLFVKLSFERPVVPPRRLARQLRLPLLAVNEGVYLTEEHRRTYRLLRAIDLNTSMDDLPLSEELPAIHRIAEAEEMKGYFSTVPEGLQNACELARAADGRDLLSPTPVFPRFRDLSEARASRVLEDLCRRGIRDRFGETSPRIEERLNRELTVIRRRGFTNYFLVVSDIVRRSPLTCGRGSSASSLVSYLLRITHVDPIGHNLYFERFLNLGRPDPPDIDVDFPWDERQRVLDYVFREYRGRAGMVANHVTLGFRACLRETAKAMALGEGEIDRIVRLEEAGKGEKIPAYIRSAAAGVRGYPYYIGTHCGGVVITPKRLIRYTHVEPSTLGYPVIAWDKESAEGAGLVKIDLLGNRSLSVLRDTVELVEARHGRRIVWGGGLPLKDRPTRQSIARGDTVGVFYIESPATRQLLRKMRRGDLHHLIIATSIIRPAAHASIRAFVDRLSGKPFQCHPVLENTLKETFGVMVFQEDVSRVAVDLVGFSTEEADTLRKTVSLGHHGWNQNRGQRMRDLRARFFRSGQQRGVPDETLIEVWRMINSFREYSFCKAHSASYALLAFKLAYLKSHYPLEFMVSVLNNGGGYYLTQTYLNESRRMGLRLTGPDINRSDTGFTAEGDRDIRVGLCGLAKIHKDLVYRIISERGRLGDFKSLSDFVERCSPGLFQMRILIRSGCLDPVSRGVTRPGLFWMYFQHEKHRGLLLPPPVPDFIEDYSVGRKRFDEVSTLGVLISCHPLAVFRRRIRTALYGRGRALLIDSRGISAHVGRRVVIAGLLTSGKEVLTRDSRRMAFVSFEDAFSIFETVLFPPALRRYDSLLDRVGVFLISGTVCDDQRALIIEVQWLERIGQGPEP